MSNPINAVSGAPTVSDRYQFLSTEDIIDTFTRRGFVVADKQVARTRKGNTEGYQNHLIRFALEDDLLRGLNNVGEERLEIVVLNDHSAKSSLKIHFGVFRFVCANGLIVSDATFGQECILHRGGNALIKLNTTINNMIVRFPAVAQLIKSMKETQLTYAEKMTFLNNAAELRFKGVKTLTTVDVNYLDSAVRTEDQGTDLWTVFNRTQEKLINGGVPYVYSGLDPDGRIIPKHGKTRKLTSIPALVSLNADLFDRASKLVKAA